MNRCQSTQSGNYLPCVSKQNYQKPLETFEFMLYTNSAMKPFGMGELAIKASFGFCHAGISMVTNPNAMFPEEHYAKNMMGADSEHYTHTNA